MSASRNILVVYYNLSHPLRQTVEDHLASFARYSGEACYYLNAATRTLPRAWESSSFDLVVFHTTFLSERWIPSRFARLMEQSQAVRGLDCPKVAIPQDEFTETDVLCQFIRDFEINHIFSCAAETEWPKIYGDIDRDRVGFSRVLTGYLDDRRLGTIRFDDVRRRDRSLDIGYRVRSARFWLGRHGLLKTLVADRTMPAARRRGLTVDISARDRDVVLGQRWADFLGNCRFTLGAEGGASILDRDGELRRRTDAYLAESPEATFEEVEAACFPGRDGELNLKALSPRHLEACATGTVQLLVEGDYNDVLVPDRHYVPIAADFENLDDALDVCRDTSRATAIAEQAFQDVCASRQYTYSHFVESILRHATAPRTGNAAAMKRRHRHNRRIETVSRAYVGLRAATRRATARLLGIEERDSVRHRLGELAGSVRRRLGVRS